MTNAACYEDDVVAWAEEQANLLRKGRLDQLDIAHLAEETGLSDFPETCPWDASEVMDPEWLPE